MVAAFARARFLAGISVLLVAATLTPRAPARTLFTGRSPAT